MKKHFFNILTLIFVFSTLSNKVLSQRGVSKISSDENTLIVSASHGPSDNFRFTEKPNPLSAISMNVPDTFAVDVRKNLILAYGYDFKKEIFKFNKISDNLILNSVWLESADYYATWDSDKLNPYAFDVTKFKDTVNIVFFDDSGELDWILPVDSARINSAFGQRRYRWHYGTDLKLDTGDSVSTVADGIVRIAKYDRRGFGHYVVVRHKNGLETLYGHFSETLVRVGQEVNAGEIIGLGGSSGRSSGSHLHLEVRYKGLAINSEEIFDYKNWRLKSEAYAITPNTFKHVIEASKKRYYRIRSGDNLGKISRRHRTTITKLCRLNGIRRTTTLRIGRRLRVR